MTKWLPLLFEFQHEIILLTNHKNTCNKFFVCLFWLCLTPDSTIFQPYHGGQFYWLLTLPEHLRLPPVFSVVRVTRSLILCVCYADRCLSLCAFSFRTVGLSEEQIRINDFFYELMFVPLSLLSSTPYSVGKFEALQKTQNFTG
jgi:hypothetical protein